MSENHSNLPARILAATLLFSLATCAQAQIAKAGDTPTAKPSPVIELPPADPMPIPAMTPEELPPNAPQVTYKDGRLTIDATNATLASILNAIRTQTGAEVTVPDDSIERVAVHLSGPPNMVIPELIDGSKYGYIIRSSPEDPDGMIELVLNRKPATGAQPTPQSAGSTSQPEIRAFDSERTRQTVTPNRAPVVADEQRPSAQRAPSNVQAIASMDPDKSPDRTDPATDKGEDAAQASAANPAALAVSVDDPHPTSPLQLTALQTASDQAQQQQVTNRQFMQDLYSARQKLQPQPTQAQQPQ